MKTTLDIFFANWNDANTATQGFVAFTYDYAQETRTQLADSDLEQLASDVAYAANEAGHDVTAEQAETWLTENRGELIEAIDAEHSGN